MPQTNRRRRLTTLVSSVAVLSAALASGLPTGAAAAPGPESRPRPPAAVLDEASLVPPTDCTNHVGLSLNKDLPGYTVPDDQLGTTCVPFTQSALAPKDYAGDYRVDEFTFAKAQERLAACTAGGKACPEVEAAKAYAPTQFRVTGTLDPVGKIDALDPHVDLRDIRRPKFFGAKPYREPIAEAEKRTYTWDLAAPADPYDRLNRGVTTGTHLRGWYLKGKGVPTKPGSSRLRRSLVILVGGRTVETTALQDPRDPLYTRSSDGTVTTVTYPSRGTEGWGTRQWREYLYKLNVAGFDVLTFDKRGHGITGGLSPDNTLQQGLDMLRSIDAVEHGRGLTVLGPDGKEHKGRSAARTLVRSAKAARKMPIVLGGPSQGSWATEWAMNANFNRWCSLDEPGQPCHQKWGHKNVKGAALLATLWGASFFGTSSLTGIAANAEVNHYVLFPTSEPLGNLRSWPALFEAKGLWDDIQGPFTTYDAYLRAGKNKELYLLRGPHSEVAQGSANVAFAQDRLVDYATRVTQGRKPTQPRYKNLKEAVAASPQTWEPSTSPTFPTR